VTTRREFFKLVAAGAALALVPFIPEPAAAILPAKESTTIIGRSLWLLRSYEVAVLGPDEIARLVLRLCRGSSAIEMTLALDLESPPPFSPHTQTEIELELAWENGGIVVVADGKRLSGVLSISGSYEPSYIDATLLGDPASRYLPGGL
jgi:hypothetical protein